MMDFIVISKDGKFLNQSDQWVQFDMEQVPAHSIQKIRMAGRWLMEADGFIPAQIDPETGKTNPHMEIKLSKWEFLRKYC